MWVDYQCWHAYKFRKRARAIQCQPEEAYLRTDVRCGSNACITCPPAAPAVAADATHYAMPDSQALTDFLEVFELPEMVNYILLSSVLRKGFQHGNMRRSTRLRALYNDVRRLCVLFDNLHHRDTAPTKAEDMVNGTSILTAADWYHNHLHGRVPIVIVSDRLAAVFGEQDQHPHVADAHGSPNQDLPPRAGASDAARLAAEGDALLDILLQDLGVSEPQPAPQNTQAPAAGHAARLAEPEPGVRIMSVHAYFERYWQHCPAIMDLVDAIQQSKAEAAKQPAGAGSTYAAHLGPASLQEALQAGSVVQGVIHMSRRGPHEATVTVGSSAEAASQHIIIVGKQAVNRAMDGDIVAVSLLPKSQWRTSALVTATDDEEVLEADEDVAEDESAAADADSADVLSTAMEKLQLAQEASGLQPVGQVVSIVQRADKSIVVCVSDEDERALTARAGAERSEAVLCVPLDRRLPKIRVRSRQWSRLRGQRFVVRLDAWARTSSYPTGHFVTALGPLNDMKAETDAVLIKCGIEWQPFSNAAMAELPVPDASLWRISPSDVAERRDLRGPDYLVCSIDPPGCVDVDDALSVRQLADGNLEVGVHIADVSHFVRQGGMLDGEARARGTTVYLVDRRLDMLPALLSEQLCSLRSGVDRLAVSVLWTLGADWAVKATWFGRTIIRSRHQLSYQQAQDILDDVPAEPGDEIEAQERAPLRSHLARLAQLKDHLHAARMAAGALELESAELRFATAPDGTPTGVQTKATLPMMGIVAEMMIFANSAVARRIRQAYPTCALLRRHQPPRQQGFGEVEALCAAVGVEFDCSSRQALARSLDAACQASGPTGALLLRSLATRAMSEAEYFSTGDVRAGGGGSEHYGLALTHYTHFTSPIRRYADVVVHRQLLAAVAGAGAPLAHADLTAAAASMNERNREAKRAQRECSDLYLLLLLHSVPHVEPALVYEVRQAGILVFIPKYQLKGLMHLVDRRGLVRPPLAAAEEDPNDPIQLGLRRNLRLETGPTSARIYNQETGQQVAVLRTNQRVWVELGADGSRAHGPSLRLRLLANSHPAVQQAQAARAEGLRLDGQGTSSKPSAPAAQQRPSAKDGVPPAVPAPSPPPGPYLTMPMDFNT
ncbi:hypothetical protein WJX72_009740 [[Myrmecia] bisecta]|uniref:DIS3-like exonuclease 1 n=1 Tax=[Myrmecia] bisecta TaxID=41462 RepID=A0AAW1P723_9CHLO